ncbi:MAG: hypothetical protein AABX66_04055 [Nanoarchaeota archaeon]
MTYTTIQVDKHVLALLKKLKQEYAVASYGEAIVRAVNSKKKKSMAGSLAKYYKNVSTEEIVKALQQERRKSDRF